MCVCVCVCVCISGYALSFTLFISINLKVEESCREIKECFSTLEVNGIPYKLYKKTSAII